MIRLQNCVFIRRIRINIIMLLETIHIHCTKIEPLTSLEKGHNHKFAVNSSDSDIHHIIIKTQSWDKILHKMCGNYECKYSMYCYHTVCHVQPCVCMLHTYIDIISSPYAHAQEYTSTVHITKSDNDLELFLK